MGRTDRLLELRGCDLEFAEFVLEIRGCFVGLANGDEMRTDVVDTERSLHPTYSHSVHSET